MGPAHWILLASGVAGVLGATVLDARDAGPEPLSYRRGVPRRGWHRYLLRAGSLFAIMLPLLDGDLPREPWTPLLVGAVIAVSLGGADVLAVTMHNRTRIERMRQGR